MAGFPLFASLVLAGNHFGPGTRRDAGHSICLHQKAGVGIDAAQFLPNSFQAPGFGNGPAARRESGEVPFNI